MGTIINRFRDWLIDNIYEKTTDVKLYLFLYDILDFKFAKEQSFALAWQIYSDLAEEISCL